MSNRKVIFGKLFLSGFLGMSVALPAGADDERRCCVDWNKLHLDSQQSQQIRSLDARWQRDFNQLQPAIRDDHKRIARMMADRQTDPVEIITLQESVERKKAELKGLALANYLKKRKVLNNDQQYNLEMLMKQAVSSRQRMINPAGQTEVMPDRVQGLMQRVRQIWPMRTDR